MAKNDWYEAGEAIRSLVQDAVERQDFTQLGSTITNVINQTVDGFQDALRESLKGYSQDGRRNREKGADHEQGGRPASGYREGTESSRAERTASEYRERTENGRPAGAASEYREGTENGRSYHAESVKFSGQEAAERIRQDMEAKRKNRQLHSFGRNPGMPGLAAAWLMAVTGYGFGGMFGLALVILAVIGDATGVIPVFVYEIMSILTALTLGMGIAGSRRIGLGNRFRRYTAMLGDRTYCMLEELASGTGKKIGYIRKDLKVMLRRGFFPEGHLDRKETCLITDNETYQQYLLTQQEADRRAVFEQEEKQQTEKRDAADSETRADGEPDSLDRECRELIEEGERYIAHIRRCNDRIPGEEMSKKLDRLELVVTRIFREVERRPELAPELRRMMSYYLPTTQKLIDAYCQFAEQPIGGQNIESTKKEIESALDTINQAFENLLDGFLENTAWDISSDISVLHTMFAQEGLTGKDFRKK